MEVFTQRAAAGQQHKSELSLVKGGGALERERVGEREREAEIEY